ncbi:MAG TPA: glutamine amidotransferase, partial [Tepidisphaeraceae bacterium]|nr:glutamine amidotransferase [Tepidisphaeraceae bacterium]
MIAVLTFVGLEKGFLSKQGDFSLSFNPSWPGQQYVGAGLWNFLLIAAAVALVIYVYRHEGRSRGVKISLGIIRGALLLMVIAMLNRPVLTLSQSRVEPSVLAVLVDDSISMRVNDATIDPTAKPQARLAAAVSLLTDEDQKLIRDLGKTHTLRFYKFDSTATPLSPTTQPFSGGPQDRASNDSDSLKNLTPSGQNTQVAQSIRAVLDDLQGQRLAGIVILTDGRDTPAQPIASMLAQLNDANVKIYPVIVGSDRTPTNLAIQSISAEEAAFKGDIVNIRATLRGSGFPSGHVVTLQLKDKKTGASVLDPTGKPVEQNVTIDNDLPVEAELQFKPTEIGQLDLVVEAAPQPGEIDDADNSREVQIAVLDAKINLLYVDGYPRWEYRYLKNEMIRDQTIDISCLLTSADPTFAQEGDKPITRFPESIEEIMDYDVVIFGDVDPRQFSDSQLQLVADFVAKRGGGFGMVAGPRWSPAMYRGTPIEAILPVNISRVQSDDDAPITQGFRPALTKVGSDSSIFRFFADRAQNEKYIREEIQPLFWYCKVVTAKPGVGEVFAEHPTESGPDGRKAPILVLGRFGAGRTLFSAIDDSWRWRFYTGESIFDTYWVQQVRYLARSKKLGQRRVTLASVRPIYELGDQVRVMMRIVDPQLLQQLPEQVRVDILDATGKVVRSESLSRQQDQPDLFAMSFSADQVGKFVVKVPPIAGG